MKTTFRDFLKISPVGLVVILISSSASAQLEVEISKLQARSVEECGIKSYKQKSNHPSCGVSSYKKGTGPACGAVSYVTKRDKLCGVELYKEGRGGPCGESVTKKTECVIDHPFGHGCLVAGKEIIDARGKVCRHKEFGVETYKSCNRAEFGVTGYKSCENPAFGTIYKTCRLPEFGVESYKTCDILRTKAEIEIYMALTEPYIAINAINMAKAQASYLFSSGQKKLSSCLIERWDSNLLYEEIVSDMKNFYLAMYGEDFLAGVYECQKETGIEEPILNDSTCAEYSLYQITESIEKEDLSLTDRRFFEVCQELQVYQMYQKWFKDNIKEVRNLQKDLVASTSSEYQRKLEDLLIKLESVQLDDQMPIMETVNTEDSAVDE